MSLDRKCRVVTDGDKRYSVTQWYNELGWVQTDIKTQWVKSFVLIPKKSYFSYQRIWGRCYKRRVDFMCDSSGLNPVIQDTEYATQKETFIDKLQGAA